MIFQYAPYTNIYTNIRQIRNGLIPTYMEDQSTQCQQIGKITLMKDYI